MKPLNTFYDTLQIARSANDSAIHAAYKTLSEKYQPDNNPEDLEGAAKEMQLLNTAYEVLSNSEKRLDYDLGITKREREIRIEEEKKAAQAAASMFPPIEMPPDLPPDPAPVPPAALAPTPAKVSPVSALKPVASASASAKGSQDFAATVMELSVADQAGFVDTQPQLASDPLQVCTVREVAAPVPGHPAIDWLRERPLAMLGTLVLAISVVAFAPWMVRVFHGVTQSELPITPDLHPTYVEPPVTSEPTVAVRAAEPQAEASAPVALPDPGMLAAEATEAAPKAARSAKRKVATKHRPSVAKNAPEPEAPTRPTEPPAPIPVIDPGGHSGFAPKCRWVTPTRWSCN